jgi:hypothetical protein
MLIITRSVVASAVIVGTVLAGGADGHRSLGNVLSRRWLAPVEKKENSLVNA